MRFADYLTSRPNYAFILTNNLGQVNLYQHKANASWKAFDLIDVLGLNNEKFDFQVAAILLEKAVETGLFRKEVREVTKSDLLDWEKKYFSSL